ncbi:hypothetical protein SNE40_019255 [Patella caerulea]|uniref:Uncharacterized protein n=1 Tax=Patella caerulea TaxID=87958 RepID=A0AAN8P9B2_PATCE
MSRFCEKDYYDDNIECSHCSTICDKAVARGSLDICLQYCKGYYDRMNRSPDGANQSNVYVEVFVPLLAIAIVVTIVVSVILMRRRRERSTQQQHPLQETRFTIEENCDAPILPQGDSGIDTHQSQGVESHQRDDPPSNHIDTGLSDTVDPRYLYPYSENHSV